MSTNPYGVRPPTRFDSSAFADWNAANQAARRAYAGHLAYPESPDAPIAELADDICQADGCDKARAAKRRICPDHIRAEDRERKAAMRAAA